MKGMRKNLLNVCLSGLLFLAGTSSWALDEKDGVYQIGSAADLKAFAELVNANNGQSFNAVLTADIVAADDQPTIGMPNNSVWFRGSFDGQGHTLTLNLKSADADAEEIVMTDDPWALFPRLAGNISNLRLKGLVASGGNKFTSGLAGRVEAEGVVISNIYSEVEITSRRVGDSSHGGIVGRPSAGTTVLNNCIFAGYLHSETSTNCGGLIGWSGNPTTLNNCAMLGEIKISDADESTNKIGRNPGNVKRNNVYYLSKGLDYEVPSDITQITEEELASGALCFMLNGDQSTIGFWQTIGTDPVPLPFKEGHQQVFGQGTFNCDGTQIGDFTYSNSGGNPTVPDHEFVNGFCKNCGASDPDFLKQNADGYYELGSAAQMVWFAKAVAAGQTPSDAVLTSDIAFDDETSAEFIPIGTADNMYRGSFDGQGHTISGLVVNIDQNDLGLFGTVGGGTTIKNIILDQTCSLTGKGYVGLVGCFRDGSGELHLENLGNEGSVTASGPNAGGVIGCNYNNNNNMYLLNCYSTGPISGGNESAQITGWLGSNLGYMENCWSISEVNGLDGTNYMKRGSSNNVLTNCYSTLGQGTQITMEQSRSGELAWKLNGEKFVDVLWYQTIGEDEHPTLDASHGLVYQAGGSFSSLNDGDDLSVLISTLQDAENEYLYDLAAEKTLKDAYAAELEALADVNTLAGLAEAYSKLMESRVQLEASAAAYARFIQTVNETLERLASDNSFSGPLRDELQEYLESDDEPNDDYPHGGAQYIIDEELLNAEQIAGETKRIEEWLARAIQAGASAGTNVTNLLVNANFADGFNGWEGQLATGFGKSTNSNVRAAEVWNATMDMHQTVTGLENGVYELQVNGAFRPYPGDDHYSTNYAPVFYANDVQNYFQASIEDIISVADAVDGYNCNLTGEYPDYSVQDINEETIGYVPQGIVGASNSFQVGRYFNSVLVNVTDGTLTIGLKQPGTGNQPEWLGFGNIQLIFHGSMDTAGDGLDRVLESMSARANTLVNVYEASSGTDYASYPNFYQGLKDELTAAIAAVETTTENEAKYALVQKFSDLFQQVYDCKKAYVSLMNQSERLGLIAGQLGDLISEETQAAVWLTISDISNLYVNGSVTTEEALKDYTSQFDFMPKFDGDVLQINTVADLTVFASLVNGGDTSLNAALQADLDLTGAEMPFNTIGETSDLKYAGTFDGQNHTITMDFVTKGESYGLFRYLEGTVKNLHVAGTFTAPNNKVGVICGEIFGGVIENCWVSSNIMSSHGGDSATGGIVGRGSQNGSIIRNCLFTGNISTENNTYNAGGIMGWSGSLSTIENCLVISEITFDQSQGNGHIIARNPGNVTVTNSYFVYPYGDVNDGALQVTTDQVTSGEVCFLLNGEQADDVHWTQTLGEDAFPVPFKNRSVVDKNDRNEFVNTTDIQSIVETKTVDEGIYNLAGQRVQKLQKGIYIVNGKKVLVK